MGFSIILVLCVGAFISHSCAAPAFDYPFEDEGALNEYTMDEGAPSDYIIDEDAPNEYIMDEGAPNDYPMDEAGAQEPADESADPVTYKYEWTDNGKKHVEQITIDKSKQTEKIHVNPNEDSEEADIIRDSKLKLTMYRFPGICLLATLDEQNTVPPNELADDLEKAAKRQNSTSQEVIHTYTVWYGDELLSDRSVLSKEMTDLCENIPIYKIEKSPTSERVKRADCTTRIVETCESCSLLFLFQCCKTETFETCTY